MEQFTIVGLDLGKRAFQISGAMAGGGVAIRKKLSRGQVLAFFADRPPCVVAMEACATAHYWARDVSHSMGNLQRNNFGILATFDPPAQSAQGGGDRTGQQDGPNAVGEGNAEGRLKRSTSDSSLNSIFPFPHRT